MLMPMSQMEPTAKTKRGDEKGVQAYPGAASTSLGYVVRQVERTNTVIMEK